uniref:Ycf1 n=1 Tax=Panagrolaimus davidi TaxID=227884 RepID=A0A914QH79_9BILA
MLKLAEEVLMTNLTRTVLVHRRFELQNNVAIPRNKNELKKLYRKKLAIPFHQRLFSIGHCIPNLKKWFKTNESEDLRITQILDYGNIAWEPQFVGDSRIPFHDERFPYRYRSNSHLVNFSLI